MNKAGASLTNKKKNKFKITPYLFIAPQIILFLVFFVAPAIIGVYAAFTKWDIFSTELPKFIGLDNFKEILGNQDSSYYRLFREGLRNTLTFVVLSVPFCIVVPMLMAVALNAKPKGHHLFQALFYMPNVLSISTVVLIWYYLFNRNLGLINNVIHAKVNWLGAQPFTWSAIIIITVWWTIGGNMVIYQAALAGVSTDILESASIDGAGRFIKFIRITLPSIRNQLAYTIVLTTILQFNIYGQPLMLTNGGPNNSTNVLLMVIRQLAFPSNGGKSLSGIAAAMALMLGAIIIVIALFQYKYSSNEE
ncbi:MAG: sugar transporter permease protein [Lachnospiraceae bacterium]|nr:sugar transporter permease protein [Lachnospiraceae bacterium]